MQVSGRFKHYLRYSTYDDLLLETRKGNFGAVK